MIQRFAPIFHFLQIRKKMILFLFTIVFWAAAIGYSFYLGDTLRYPDERWYFNDYAQNLAKSRMFSRNGTEPTAFHPPLYPLLLGVLVMLGGGIITARLINFLALFITLLILFFWLEKRHSGLAPVFSLILTLAYPVLFYTASTLYPQTIGALFLVLTIALYWQEPSRMRNGILAGIAMGLAVLTIPTLFFVPFFILLFSLVFCRSTLRKAIILIVLTFVVMSPWIIRNYLVFHRFIPLSTNSGLNFLIGNNPEATPNSGVNVNIQSIHEEVVRQGLNEFDANRYYVEKALSFIRENPTHYIGLYILKVLNYFNFRNELHTLSEASFTRDLVMLIGYGLLVSMTFLRLIIFHRHPLTKMEAFLLLLYISSAFINAFFFTRIRFRVPFDYLLITGVSLFLDKLVENSLLRKG